MPGNKRAVRAPITRTTFADDWLSRRFPCAILDEGIERAVRAPITRTTSANDWLSRRFPCAILDEEIERAVRAPHHPNNLCG